MTGDIRYGRTDDQWNLLVAEATEFLVERARLGKVTSYTELNASLVRRTGLAGFDFERQEERAAMGHLLGLVVERTMSLNGLMLSALVHYLDANDAGPGFYTLARKLGLLPPSASASSKLEFWVRQVADIHRYYGGAPIRNRTD